ncbi:MAG TPA: hypothetical protein VLX31_19595 [Streptosporangiaceae bacterium]|nr:hypothetical protein [Streptosporangiaceae bacterium]
MTRYSARFPAPAALAVVALAAAAVLCAALPMHGASRGAKPVLIVAALCAAGSVAQLAGRMLAQGAARPAESYLPTLTGLASRAWAATAAVPWPQLLLVAVLVLEVLHPSRPWHTVLLGLILLGYLLALHLAETGARVFVLRGQLRLIAAGAALGAVSVGAGLLPAGAGSGWLTAVAGVAAVIAAGLALPV